MWKNAWGGGSSTTVLDGVDWKSRVRFYVFVDITPSTCRTVLIFLPFERTMFELHFTYLGHVHILSRKFFREVWTRFLPQKWVIFDSFWGSFLPLKSVKIYIFLLFGRYILIYASCVPNFFLLSDRAIFQLHFTYLEHVHSLSRKVFREVWT